MKTMQLLKETDKIEINEDHDEVEINGEVYDFAYDGVDFNLLETFDDMLYNQNLKLKAITDKANGTTYMTIVKR